MKKGFLKRFLFFTLALLLTLSAGSRMPGAAFAAETGTTETTEAAETAETAGDSESAGEIIRLLPDMQTDGYDLVFCIDNSQSTDKVKSYYYEALKQVIGLAMGSDIHVAVVYYSGEANTDGGVHNFVDISTEEGYQQAIKNLDPSNVKRDDINTNIGSGLAQAHEFFQKASDPDRKRIVLLLSDGYNNNTEGSQDFRDEADAQTRKAVEQLQGDKAEIYCMYVDPSVVDASDYLKQIVNYFGDNHYETDRFRSLKTTNIEQLGNVFRELFYNSQDNKKACAIDIDNGRDMFYVPLLGVQRVVLYLDTQPGNTSLTTDNEELAPETFTNEETFYFIEPEEKGYYNVSVTGEDADSVSGSVAYYAYLEAGLEMQPEADGSRTLKLHFYEADGRETIPDDNAEITAVMTDVDGNETSLTLSADENGYPVAEIPADLEGDYQIAVHVAYEQYVNIAFTCDYSLEKIAAQPAEQTETPQTVPDTEDDTEDDNNTEQENAGSNGLLLIGGILLLLLLILIAIILVVYRKKANMKKAEEKEAHYAEAEKAYTAFGQFIQQQKDLRKKRLVAEGAWKTAQEDAEKADKKQLISDDLKMMSGYEELMKAVDASKLPKLLDIADSEDRVEKEWENLQKAYKEQNPDDFANAYTHFCNLLNKERTDGSERNRKFNDAIVKWNDKCARLEKILETVRS